MHEQMGIRNLNGKCAALVVLVCLLVPSGRKLYGAASLRLSKEGYSPVTKTLLIAIRTGDQESRRSCLAAYDEARNSTKRLAIAGDRAPSDFAWVPGHAAFVGIANLKEVILFQKDNSEDGYTPTPIQCPAGVWPAYCSWSPKDQWLVVNCLDQANASRGTLWLYKLGDKSLQETGLAVDNRAVTWGNDGLLYATKDNEVMMVELTDERPRVVRNVPLGEQFSLFYGVFGQQPLFQAQREVKLGNKTLIVLDQPQRLRVMATESNIFLSVSPRCLAVFDTEGREIARSDPGRLIQFGSVKDPNTVYALADSSLVCLSVVKRALKIQTVADLEKLEGK
jgi:hypothetical protein